MSKIHYRKLTDKFLNNIGGTLSYTPEGVDSLPIPEGSKLTDEILKSNPYLTGAQTPIIPMSFSISGKNGKPIHFMMLVNPQNINHGKTNTTNLAYTRKGYVSQLWGPNQDILTGNGKTAAFMIPQDGISNSLRPYSFSYANFMALVNTYKNNGYRIFDSTDVKSTSRVIDVVTGVEVAYDGQIFMGHFSNFTLDESAEQPYLFNYNFEMVISTDSTNYNYVRGHFRPISDVEDISNNDVNSTNDESTSGKARTLSDQGDDPSSDIQPSKPKDESTTYDTWVRVTRKPWSDAARLGYTTGTAQDNLALRARLLNESWEFSPSKTVTI